MSTKKTLKKIVHTLLIVIIFVSMAFGIVTNSPLLAIISIISIVTFAFITIFTRKPSHQELHDKEIHDNFNRLFNENEKK
jgi:ABC-type bacteriocin/lantibiotic exporter with double-glycine peptidase domain